MPTQLHRAQPQPHLEVPTHLRDGVVVGPLDQNRAAVGVPHVLRWCKRGRERRGDKQVRHRGEHAGSPQQAWQTEIQLNAAARTWPPHIGIGATARGRPTQCHPFRCWKLQPAGILPHGNDHEPSLIQKHAADLHKRELVLSQHVLVDPPGVAQAVRGQLLHCGAYSGSCQVKESKCRAWQHASARSVEKIMRAAPARVPSQAPT